MADLPKIISVDDHIVEPADLWTSRLPSKYADVGPRIIRKDMPNVTYKGGQLTVNEGGGSTPADWWLYEKLQRPLLRVDSAVGVPRDQVTMTGITYEDMRPGSYSQKERLEDMDVNHIEASLCFPTFPRFCGQTFSEASDKELALLCVQAYNDYQVEEWCAGSNGRLVPLIIVPLWDPNLAAEEVRRNAARGVHAVCFSEIPAYLGLPSVHDPDQYWDPFFAACNETEMVINMHIGSSSKMPSTSTDAPAAVGSSLTHINAELSMTRTVVGAASPTRSRTRHRPTSPTTSTAASSTTPTGSSSSTRSAPTTSPTSPTTRTPTRRGRTRRRSPRNRWQA